MGAEYVYLIRQSGYHKIGLSDRPARRLQQLDVGPEPAELVHVIPTSDAAWLERAFHQMFNGKRVRGEWFRLSADEVRAFAAVPRVDCREDFLRLFPGFEPEPMPAPPGAVVPVSPPPPPAAAPVTAEPQDDSLVKEWRPPSAIRSVPDDQRWRFAWNNGFVPGIPAKAMAALIDALANDDPRLIQGATTVPPPLDAASGALIEGADAISFCGWQGWGLTSVADVVAYFDNCCSEADGRLGEPGDCRWFLNWFDDTPRDEMRRSLLAELGYEGIAANRIKPTYAGSGI